MRTPSQQIGEEGEDLFPTLLSKEFLAQKQTKDYGIDFMVQYFRNGSEPSGLHFGVAVRSAESLREAKGLVTRKLEVKNVKNYVDRQRIPIFLVAINLNEKCGYWLFIQEYVKKEYSGKAWRDQKTLNFRIPAANNLSNLPNFSNAIVAATEYMNELYPGSILSAIQSEQERIKQKDPRIDLKTSVIDGKIHHEIICKEPVTFNINFKKTGKKTIHKLESLFDRGTKETFESTECEISGLSFLEETLTVKGSTLTISPHSESVGDLRVSITQGGRILQSVESVPATLRGGNKVITITAGFLDSPLRISLEHKLKTKKVQIGLRWFRDLWLGMPLTTLPYFDQVKRLLGFFAQEKCLRFEFNEKGNEALGFSVNYAGEEIIKTTLHFLDFLAMAREVARRYQTDTILPEQVKKEEIAEVQFLFNLLTTGKVRRPTANGRVTVDLPIETTERWSRDSNVDEKGTYLTLTAEEDQLRRFLGTTINCGRFNVTYTHVIPFSCQKDTKSDGKEYVRMEFSCADDCMEIYEIPPSESAPVKRV